MYKILTIICTILFSSNSYAYTVQSNGPSFGTQNPGYSLDLGIIMNGGPSFSSSYCRLASTPGTWPPELTSKYAFPTNSNNGTQCPSDITATLSTPGTYSFTFQVSNCAAFNCNQENSPTFTITISSPTPPSVSPGATNFGTVVDYDSFSQAFTVTLNGSDVGGCSTTSGAIPTGSNYNGSCSLLSGTLATPGSYSWTQTYTDTTNSTSTSYAYSIIVSAAVPPSVSPGSIPFGTVSNPATLSQSFAITRSGVDVGGCSTSAGAVPIGASYNAGCTQLSGTLATAGSYSWNENYTDTTNGTNTTYNYSLTVPPFIATPETVLGSEGVMAQVDLTSTIHYVGIAVASLITIVLVIWGWALIQRALGIHYNDRCHHSNLNRFRSESQKTSIKDEDMPYN